MTKNSDIYGEPSRKPVIKKDKYVQAVRKRLKERSNRGIEKYGVTLEREDIDVTGWLNHLQEELMDATLYIERLKTSYEDKETTAKGKRSLGK